MREGFTAEVARVRRADWLRGRRPWLLYRHRFDRLHRPNKTVTAPRHRLHIARATGRIPQRVAQPLDGGVDAVVELDHGIIRPQRLADLVAEHHVTGMLEHHEKNAERLLVQPDLDALLAQFGRANIELEGAEPDDARSRSGPADRHESLPRRCASARLSLSQPSRSQRHSP